MNMEIREDNEYYEPTPEELEEIEELIKKDQYEFDDGYTPNRVYYYYKDFSKFREWLGKNGILW